MSPILLGLLLATNALGVATKYTQSQLADVHRKAVELFTKKSNHASLAKDFTAEKTILRGRCSRQVTQQGHSPYSHTSSPVEYQYMSAVWIFMADDAEDPLHTSSLRVCNAVNADVDAYIERKRLVPCRTFMPVPATAEGTITYNVQTKSDTGFGHREDQEFVEVKQVGETGATPQWVIRSFTKNKQFTGGRADSTTTQDAYCWLWIKEEINPKLVPPPPPPGVPLPPA